MKLHTAALTDIGRLRRNNEDRFLCDAALRLFGVADGIGGLPAGAEAATLAVDGITAAIATNPAAEVEDLRRIVQRVNREVAELGSQLSPASGIGTTLTFGWFGGKSMLLAHVGDSRCYRWAGSKLELLTEDHSVENEALHRRARGEKVHITEYDRHALTRCIGQPGSVEVDVTEHPLNAGDVYLFASDGVTRMIDDEDLAEFLNRAESPAQRLDALVAEANRRGGPDNATAVLVVVEDLL